jgi:hypothetical protein
VIIPEVVILATLFASASMNQTFPSRSTAMSLAPDSSARHSNL